MKAATQKHPLSNRTEQLLQQRVNTWKRWSNWRHESQAWKPNSLN